MGQFFKLRVSSFSGSWSSFMHLDHIQLVVELSGLENRSDIVFGCTNMLTHFINRFPNCITGHIGFAKSRLK